MLLKDPRRALRKMVRYQKCIAFKRSCHSNGFVHDSKMKIYANLSEMMTNDVLSHLFWECINSGVYIYDIFCKTPWDLFYIESAVSLQNSVINCTLWQHGQYKKETLKNFIVIVWSWNMYWIFSSLTFKVVLQGSPGVQIGMIWMDDWIPSSIFLFNS